MRSILTPADTTGLEEILKIAEDAGVPVVVEANPVDGMSTMVAICDYDAGFDLGIWVGNKCKKCGRFAAAHSRCRPAVASAVSVAERRVRRRRQKHSVRMRS